MNNVAMMKVVYKELVGARKMGSFANQMKIVFIMIVYKELVVPKDWENLV